MTGRYDPQRIEERWQKRWRDESAFRAPDRPKRPKRYVLEMFPYPSGRIHMGHVRCYAIGDVIARYGRMRGYDVLHPMGWDAFGLPAENAAIQHGVPPGRWTRDNIETMRHQLRRLGLSYDWDRELATCDPEYYRWEQFIFLRMLERGLAYRRKAAANWCPSCETVLANEQVEEGTCWRCGSVVEERELDQWFLRITDYAEELLDGLDGLDGWPERVRAMQRNWIGKSVGAEIRFPIEGPRPDGDESITVFTTRPDTLYGATFMSLAVEHPLVRRLADVTGQAGDVDAFARRVRMQSREERAGGKEGIFLGAYCRNPLSGRRMPIYAANFVLMEYGTGAVMAVPTHDQRDFEFARAYDLPLVVVIEPEGESLDPETMTEAWEGPGRMVHSGPFDGLSSEEGKSAVADHLAREGLGGPTIQYRLRDWCISRQRYWGTPIPVAYCDRCGVVAVPESELPVLLPEDVPFTGEGGSPLERSEQFLRAKCARCGGPARRETDTMDTFVDSSWYFARFASPDETRGPLDPDRVDRWLPVDQYVGGIEHAVLHLIYARFYTKVLRDLGFLSVDEPFRNLLTQGMVSKETLRCPEHGWLYPEEVEDGACTRCRRPAVVGRVEAMSKSKRNIVDPEDLIARYGADAVRLFSLFAAPPERDLEWSDQGLEGASRFLGRLWRLALQSRNAIGDASAAEAEPGAAALELRRKLHRTLRKVTDDVGERFHFNTAIAAVMEFVNALGSFVDQGGMEEPGGRTVLAESFRTVLRMLHPMVPHVTEELWVTLGFGETMAREVWPEVDASALEEETVLVVVQVNGRVRARVRLAKGASEDEVVAQALEEDAVCRNLDGRKIRKRIYVPDRLLNLVVG